MSNCTQALTTLDLYQNEISDQGIQYLANMLRQNKVLYIQTFDYSIYPAHFYSGQTLTTLHLSQNRIDDEGAEYLAYALRKNRVITSHIFSPWYTFLNSHRD